MPAPPSRLRRLLLACLAAACLALAAGCSGGGSGGSGQPAAEVLRTAKATLDETSGVRIGLVADALPSGVTGVQRAEGVGTHAPAFEGTLTVPVAGTSLDVPVVAVGGKVYARLPFTTGYQQVNPAEYGAPDPARLMSTDGGLSSLLTETSDLRKGQTVRGGQNNDEILTEYTGTVPSSAVEVLIPSASGDFDATYTVTDGGELRTAELTGEFYAGNEPVTYTITLDDYGIQPDISAP